MTKKKRLKRIKDAPEKQEQSFWCDECEEDFTAVGIKSPIPSNIPEYVYRAEHDCGEPCVRRITELHLDLFFSKSEKLWRARNRNRVDTLQRHSKSFKVYYGDGIDKEEDEQYEREQEVGRKNYDNSLRLLTDT